MKNKKKWILSGDAVLLTVFWEMIAINTYAGGYNGLQQVLHAMILAVLCFTVIYSGNKYGGKGILTLLTGRKTLAQLWTVLLFVSMFNLCAVVSSAVKQERTLYNLKGAILIWVIEVGLTLYLLLGIQIRKELKRLGSYCKQNKGLFLVILVSAVLRIPMLGSFQRWDAGEYYYRLGTACKKYDFTFLSFIRNFRLCNHSTLGFSFIMGLAEFLTPRNSVGVLIWNLILTLLAMGCLYSLIKHVWIRDKEWITVLITLGVSVTPIFLGTFGYVNVDYLMALAFVFVLYFDYKGWYLLELFAAVILSQTKETGVVVVAGYFIVRLLWQLIATKGKLGEKIASLFRNHDIWVAMWAACAYASQMILIGGLSSWSQDGTSSFGWNSKGKNCFGISPHYIFYKFKQYTLVNFAGVLVIMILVSFCILWKKKRIKTLIQQWKNLIGILGAMAFFCLFGFLYITSALVRYNIIYSIMLTLLAFCMLYYALKDKWGSKLFGGIVSVTGVLMLIQSFWQIDPVPNHVLDQLDIGNDNSILYCAYGDPSYYGDPLVTNRQYIWLDQALNQMFADSEFDAGTVLFQTQRQDLGTHYNGNPGIYDVGWDADKQERIYIDSDTEDYVPIAITYANCITAHFPWRFRPYTTLIYGDCGARGILPFIPYYHDDEQGYLDLLSPIYYISDVQTASSYGGTLRYYELIQRESYCGLTFADLQAYESGQNVFSEGTGKEELFRNALEDSGFSLEEVEDFYHYLLVFDGDVEDDEELESAGDRTVVQENDSVQLEFVLFNQDGEELQSCGNYESGFSCVMVAGMGELLPEVDQLLIGAEVGDTLRCEWTIPEQYNILSDYAGQTVVLQVTVNEIRGVKQIDLTREEQMEIYEDAFDTVWDYYAGVAMKQILLAVCKGEISIDETLLAEEAESVNQYFEEYLQTEEMSLEEYLDCAGMTEEEYEAWKGQLARAGVWYNAFQKELSTIQEEYNQAGYQQIF